MNKYINKLTGKMCKTSAYLVTYM